MTLINLTSNFLFNSFNSFISLYLLQKKTTSSSLSSSSSSSNSSSLNIKEQLQKYRLIIQAYIEELASESISKQCNNNELDQIDVIIDIINDINKLLYATEIFILNNNEIIHIEVIQLLQGILDDIDYLDINDPNKVYTPSTSKQYSDYWILVFDLVLRGKLNLAWQLLLTHPDIESRNDQEIKELEFIFNSHPCLNENNTPYQKSSDLSFSYHTGSISREKTDEWLQWKQNLENYLFNRHYSLCHIIPELSSIINVLRGQLKDIHLMSSITQREDDWKTDAICNLLYCQPSITRNEVVRAIEESMTRVQSLSLDHPGTIIKDLLHYNVSSLLETTFKRIYTPIPHLTEDLTSSSSTTTTKSKLSSNFNSTSMDIISTTNNLSSSITFGIQNILKSSVLVIITHLCYLFQLSGVLDGGISTKFSSKRKLQSIQRDFIENTVDLTVDSFIELNIPIEISVKYLSILSPLKGKNKSKTILLNHKIQSDSDAVHISQLLKSISLETEANSILVNRGLFWLKRSIRENSDTPSQLYRKGGMETKALSFFIRGFDSRKARALLDHSIKRCIISTSQSKLLSTYLKIKYNLMDDVIPSFNEQETINNDSIDFNLLNLEIISTLPIEINIASGLICAIDEAIGVSVCGPEAVFLRYYVEAIQSLLLVSNSFSSTIESNYENIISELNILLNTSTPCKFLIGPSQTIGIPLSITSCQFTCPQRYWIHIIDLILIVNQLYNQKYQQLEEIVNIVPLSPVEYDIINEQYDTLPIVLFTKNEIEIMLQMIHNLHVSYLPNKVHLLSESSQENNIISVFNQSLLDMLQTSIYVTNYEQYESIASTTQQFGKSTFSLFRSKNSKFSANKTFLSQNKSNERKSNFHLVPDNTNNNNNNNSINSNNSNSNSTNNNSSGNKGKNKLSKYSTFLTVSPSSLSYRLTSSTTS